METVRRQIMPNRMLRDWTDSLRFEALPANAERLFVRLIMKADDFGRFHADARLVRAACFPFEDYQTKGVKADLETLAERGLIYPYTVDGSEYLAIINYGQRLKQSKPKFPPEDGQSDEWKPTSGKFREVPARREEKRREVEEKDNTAGKVAYGEFLNVMLSLEERQKLVDIHGEEMTARAIDELGAWMQAGGKKKKDHYACLHKGSWVWEKVGGQPVHRKQRRVL